jgi:hypothetical protein
VGRQIQLSLLAKDASVLIHTLSTWAPVVVVASRGDSAIPGELTTIHDSAEWQKLILSNKRIAPSVQRRFIVGAKPPYYLLDEQAEPVLELSLSALTEWNGTPALTQGRIYGAFFEEKPTEFKKWFERITHYIRKHWRKNPVSCLSGYVGPSASEWFEAGGLLLPSYMPPVRNDWIERLAEQHHLT